MPWHQRELTLEDILSDPITNEVMKADGVDPHQLSAKLKETARTWADAHARVGGKGGSIIGADRRSREPVGDIPAASAFCMADGSRRPTLWESAMREALQSTLILVLWIVLWLVGTLVGAVLQAWLVDIGVVSGIDPPWIITIGSSFIGFFVGAYAAVKLGDLGLKQK